MGRITLHLAFGLLGALCVCLAVSAEAAPSLSRNAVLPLHRVYEKGSEGFKMDYDKDLQHVIARDRARHRRVLSNVVDFPVGGVADPYVAGLYFTIVYLGTPPRPYYVQIDTGSDLLWVNCKSCRSCPLNSGLGIDLHFFDNQASTTASAITCSDSTCDNAKQFITTDCTSTNYCGYSVSYGDQSSTTGYYVTDVFHYNEYNQFDTNTTSAKVMFGCSYSQTGELAKPERAVDGIFGFGQHGLSVISQLSSQGLVRKVFSHCLKGGDHGGGILVLGEITEPGMVYTPIVKSTAHYNLNLQGIAVNGQQLQIDSEVFATGDNSGTIIDSGTTLAYLAEEAFDIFVSAIVASVPQLPQVTSPNGNPCFLVSDSIDKTFPSVTLYFEEAAMELNPQEYLIQRSSVEMSSMWCIGWQKSGKQPSDRVRMTILGDIVLKDKVIVYDLEQQRIGWTRYDCLSSVNVSTATGESKSIDSTKLNNGGSVMFERIQKLPLSILLLCIYLTISSW